MNRESTISLSIDEFVAIKSISDFTGLLHENTKQTDAWEEEFITLQTALKGYEGTIIFEYGIPGLQRVIDVVLLIGQTVFVLEFKAGADKHTTSDLNQVMGYALRLKYFHSESNMRVIVPILIATENKGSFDPSALDKLDSEDMYKPICCNSGTLRDVLKYFTVLNSNLSTDPSWQDKWAQGVYNPSPSIIEAVIAAWDKQNVAGLSKNDVDEEGKANHLKAESDILNIIESTKASKKKSIIFVTGVPGAGKTLVGLNTSIQAQSYGASMLSGNGPLVEVLTEALKRNVKQHKSSDLKSELAVESIIRQVYTYKNEIIDRLDYTSDPYKMKPDATLSCQHVIIYDEAQRAWSRDKMISHTSRAGKKDWQNQNWKFSEPEILMWDLAQLDWGVMVCLIGGGQEINKGEAGINEWLRALKDNDIFKDWNIYMAPELTSPEYNTLKLNGGSISEICDELKNPIEHIEPLHLKDCQRTSRAKGLSNFINLLVEGKATKDDYYEIQPFFRIYLTRDIEKAKKHIRKRKVELNPRATVDTVHATEIRTGVLMSSKAKRMRPYGYEIKKENDYRAKAPDWFLDLEVENIESSDRLEVALSEFLVQGLEIDLGIVLWDADFRYNPESKTWTFHSCGKNKWNDVHDATRQFYMRNAYRVLLTRARSEMVIYVPEGDVSDATRLPSLYDHTFEYLASLGFHDIDI